MASKEHDFKCKVVLVGDSGVGKRSLAKQATINVLKDDFLDRFGVVMTLYNIRAKDKARTINMSIMVWDITGALRKGKLRDSYSYGVQGAIVVADASRPESIEHVGYWGEDLTKKFKDIEVVFVLNKVDLLQVEGVEKARKKMREYTDKYQGPLILTSGPLNMNVQKPFVEIGKRIYQKNYGDGGEFTTEPPGKDRLLKARTTRK